jgi:hypothetical protein
MRQWARHQLSTYWDEPQLLTCSFSWYVSHSMLLFGAIPDDNTAVKPQANRCQPSTLQHHTLLRAVACKHRDSKTHGHLTGRYLSQWWLKGHSFTSKEAEPLSKGIVAFRSHHVQEVLGDQTTHRMGDQHCWHTMLL